MLLLGSFHGETATPRVLLVHLEIAVKIFQTWFPEMKFKRAPEPVRLPVEWLEEDVVVYGSVESETFIVYRVIDGIQLKHFGYCRNPGGWEYWNALLYR